MLQTYFKIAWRNLIKNKGYSFINIGGLALGMSVAVLVALWTIDELNFNKCHNNYNSIAKVYRNNFSEEGIETNTSMVAGLGTLLRVEYASSFKNVVMRRQQMEDKVFSFEEKKMTQSGIFIQTKGVEMFGLEMIKGSGTQFLDNVNSIIISESLSRKLFGTQDPVNKVLTMDAENQLKVTGVYKDLPKNSELFGSTFFAPLELYFGDKEKFNAWDNYNVTVYVQLHNSADLNKTSTLLKNVMLPHISSSDKSKPQLFLHPMSDWHLNSEFENGALITSKPQKMLWSYFTIGVFVLFLACINFMNLSTARSEKRAREVGIRKSMGSHRSNLIQQFFSESLLVAFLSFLIAILIVQFTLPAFNTIADKELFIPFSNLGFWLYCILGTTCVGLLAGMYPALYLSSFNPVTVLKGTFKAGRSAMIARNILVTAQFTISIALIAATVIVYQQIQFAKNRPVGYSREGLISFRPRSPEFKGKFLTLRDELKKTGMVEEIAEANYSINSTLGWNPGFSWNGKEYEQAFNTIFVSPEYGKTIGWQFVKGRDFSREISSDMTGIIINESALKILGIKDPVGEHLLWRPMGEERGRYQILGVVKDMVKGSPFNKTEPSIIFLSSYDFDNLYLRVNPNVSIHEALQKIQEVFSELIPSAPFDYTFADDDYTAKFKNEERTGELAAILTIIAILISSLGLFGLTSFVAEQRTKEIGIRKVLGASVLTICQVLSRDFIVLVFIACLIAIPLSYFAMKGWLQSYEYRTEIKAWIFLVASLFALCITVATVSYQSIKAAIANPIKSLRSE